MLYRKTVSLSVAALLLACMLTGCGGGGPLSSIWMYTHSEQLADKGKVSSADNDNDAGIRLNLNPSHFLCLQPDGNYSMDFGSYEYGTWKLMDNVIQLTDSDRKIKGLEMQMLGRDEMMIITQSPGGGRTGWHFESSRIKVKPSDNPFAIENNRWRIKAVAKENDEAIAERLRNHFRYWEKYFYWGMETEKTSLDVRSLAGPLKMYGNGFKLIPFEDWPAEWTSLFFDRDDAYKAYGKLESSTFNKLFFAIPVSHPIVS